jgi:hypothetical protein
VTTKNEEYVATIISSNDSRGEEAKVKINDKEYTLMFPEYSKYGWNRLHEQNALYKLEKKQIKVYLTLFLLRDKDMHFKNTGKKHIRQMK